MFATTAFIFAMITSAFALFVFYFIFHFGFLSLNSLLAMAIGTIGTFTTIIAVSIDTIAGFTGTCVAATVFATAIVTTFAPAAYTIVTAFAILVATSSDTSARSTIAAGFIEYGICALVTAACTDDQCYENS